MPGSCHARNVAYWRVWARRSRRRSGAAQGPIGAVCGGSCTDVWGKATSTSYDQAGRVTQATNPGGTVGYGYTTDGLVDTVSLNGGVLADPMYNGWGRMTGVLYPSGGTNKGNATSGSFTIDPVWFRPNGVTWSGPGGAIAANAHDLPPPVFLSPLTIFTLRVPQGTPPFGLCLFPLLGVWCSPVVSCMLVFLCSLLCLFTDPFGRECG